MSTYASVVAACLSLCFVACAQRTGVDERRRHDAPVTTLSSDTSTEAGSHGTDTSLDDVIVTSADGSLGVAGIYLAQTHVLPVDSEYACLVSDREALLKVDLIARKPDEKAPNVLVTTKLASQTATFKLVGPALVPTVREKKHHGFSDSYTVMLPKEWIRPGLVLQIVAGPLAKDLTVQVGAPNPLHLTLLHFNIFRAPKPVQEPPDWPAEFQVKLPISSLTIERRDPILFTEVVIPPRPDVKLPAVRVRSTQEYKDKTGANFDGEQGFALGLTNAIQAASGHGRLSVYYTNVAGVGVGGGLADPFTGMGIAGNLAVFFHEFGHTLSLGHWANHQKYPHQTDVDGIKGDPGHVGPTWGFDPRKGAIGDGIQLPYFIPPIVQANSVGREPGVFKKDPMAGGGSGDQEKGFHFRMFSDFSVHQMQAFLEDQLIIWDEGQKAYLKWDQAQQQYKPTPNNGVDLPVEREASVYTIIYGVSAATPEANFVYTPLGPYQSGMIKLFDANVAEDRTAAQMNFCKPQCDFTLRVTQSGRSRSYIVRGQWKPNQDPLKNESYFVGALNVASDEGAVDAVELLLTPNVDKAGIAANPASLYQYRGLSNGGQGM